MLATPSRIPWTRIAAESIAIIASILLAFAIDAWWEQRVERSRSFAQLETIRTEFIDVEQRLARLDEQLMRLRKAVSDLLTQVGPDSPVVSTDTLATLIDLTFRVGRIELPTGSLQALLASGELSSVPSIELKGLLAAWPAEVSRLSNQSSLLEENREEIIRYLHDKIPTLAITHKTSQMDAYPQSRFSGNAEILQRDMKVEGLFANRGMMIEDTLAIVYELKGSTTKSVTLIDTISIE